ncbi:MAG: NAD(P)/FAD-dependent oxidoreductase [Luteibaculaceae bacterium]
MYYAILIGQGISGSVLASHLIHEGKKILVIDNGFKSASSMAAAGLWNPMVFRKIGKSYMADSLVPYLFQFYRKEEKKLMSTFFHPLPIHRVLADENQKNQWDLVKRGEEFPHFTSKSKIEIPSVVNAKYGLGEVKMSGWLDTGKYLTSMRDFLRKSELLLEEEFDYAQLSLTDNSVRYKSFVAEKVIFCQGYKANECSFFNWLPISKTKGQTLTVKTAGLKLDTVLNYGNFILPLQEENTFRIGATFEWHQESDSTTDKAKMELLLNTQKVLTGAIEFEVLNQRAGFRPTVKDRRPIVGPHPVHKNVYVFNGMGAKGVMLAPWFANNFTQHLLNGKPIWERVNVSRFYPE